jgi:drug/metabolite transporter (DMT)-like permease
MRDHPLLKGFAYILFSILVWSGWTVASRFAMKGMLTAYDITAIRFTTAGVIFLAVAIRRGLSIGPWGWRSGLLLAALMGAPYTLLAVAGMRFAPASHAGTVINGSLLVLTTIVGIHGLRETTSLPRLVGVACSIGGIICMLAAKSTLVSTPDQWKGHLLFIASGLMWGTYTVLVRGWKLDAVHAAATVCVYSMLIYMPIYLLFLPSHMTLAHWHEVAFQSFYQGVLTGVLAFITFNRGIHILGASRAGAMTPLVPVLATLLAIPILGEVPTPLEWTGVFAVSFGVFLGSGILRWPTFSLQALVKAG